MKKIFAFALLSAMMVVNMSLGVYAANDSSNYSFMNESNLNIAESRSLKYYIEFYQDSQMVNGKASQSFVVDSTYKNLKLIMASTETVRVRLYNLGTGRYVTLDNGQAYVTIPGDSSSHTISLKTSCPSGNYRLEFYSDYVLPFYTVYSVCGAQYN